MGEFEALHRKLVRNDVRELAGDHGHTDALVAALREKDLVHGQVGLDLYTRSLTGPRLGSVLGTCGLLDSAPRHVQLSVA